MDLAREKLKSETDRPTDRDSRRAGSSCRYWGAALCTKFIYIYIHRHRGIKSSEKGSSEPGWEWEEVAEMGAVPAVEAQGKRRGMVVLAPLPPPCLGQRDEDGLEGRGAVHKKMEGMGKAPHISLNSWGSPQGIQNV